MENNLCPPDRTGRAYEIIKRLEEQKNLALLEQLYASVKEKERKKGLKGTKDPEKSEITFAYKKPLNQGLKTENRPRKNYCCKP